MPLFHKRETLSIEGLSKNELTESDAYFVACGITIEMVSQDIERARQLMLGCLQQAFSKNLRNKYWVYYLLGNMLFDCGQLDDAITVHSGGSLEYPDDPRAYYSLGVIYYGICEASQLPNNASLQNVPPEIQKRMSQVRHFEEQNPQLVEAFRGSKSIATREYAAKWALKYFNKTLTCNISNEDKDKIRRHIQIIEMQTKSW